MQIFLPRLDFNRVCPAKVVALAHQGEQAPPGIARNMTRMAW